MPKCVFERATGLYVSGTRYDDVPHDPATHVQIVLADFPDRRLQRWDGALGARAATALEIVAYDAAILDARAATEFDDQKALKAMALYFRDQINVCRAQHGLPALTVAEVRQGIIDKYKTLP